MKLPHHLETACQKFGACDGTCGDAVRRDDQTNRWFITIGHAGFNTRANNLSGYLTENLAKSAMLKLVAKQEKFLRGAKAVQP